MPGPLAGLRVLELARILAGPWAGQILADLGADVVKVERKGTGDDTRGWGPPFVAASDGSHLGAAYFHATNRGKRSIELDFESEDGRRIVKKLAARSDVLIENFKVGGLAKFGLDYTSLRKENPRLIYCSVTGFGQTGPYAARAGYDLMAQGMGGFMDLTGAPDGEPQRAGVPVADIFTGVYSVVGILAALAERERTGRGCQVDTALVDIHGRRARQPGAQLSRLRQGAQAHRQCASQHRALPGLSGRRRPHHHRHRQRQPVRQIVRGAGRARNRQRAERIATTPIGSATATSWSRASPRSPYADRAPSCWRSWKRCRRAGRPDQHARSGVRRPAGDPSRHADRPAEHGGQGGHDSGRAHADHDRRQADGGGAPSPRGSASIRRKFCARSARSSVQSICVRRPSGDRAARWRSRGRCTGLRSPASCR